MSSRIAMQQVALWGQNTLLVGLIGLVSAALLSVLALHFDSRFPVR